MLEDASKLSLKIKTMVTCQSAAFEDLRSELSSKVYGTGKIWDIDVGRDDISSDVKLLVADRFQINVRSSNDLVHLSSKTQDKVRDQIEKNATTLIYVDFALRYLSGLGREGAILRELGNGLPIETSALFVKILRNCKRRLPQDLSSSVQLLLVWLTYSFDLLDLDQANHLIQLCNSNEDIKVEEEIEFVFNRVVRIGPTTRALDEPYRPELENSPGSIISKNDAYNDGNLLVSLRDPSMRQFLCGIDITSWDQRGFDLKYETDCDVSSTITSTGHRVIFLYCCRLLEPQQKSMKNSAASKNTQELKHYAMMYSLRHWQHIDNHRHNHSENMEVCSALYNLLANRRGLAAALESKLMTIDDIIKKTNAISVEEGHRIFSQVWQTWARSTQESDKYLDVNEQKPSKDPRADIDAYWKTPSENALQPLFAAHMRNWLDGWCEQWDPEAARDCALVTLQHVS